MIRQLRITLKGRAYDVTVEDLTATSGATSTATAAATTTMTPMPGPFVPPAKSTHAEITPAATAAASAVGGPGDRLAPLAGVIYEISVKVGDMVAVDDPLVVLEAMKMKTTVGAHKAGRVVAVLVSTGDAVDADQPLVTIA
jgi:biotin carboxyl carrier protein